jgi:hypothetical protein
VPGEETEEKSLATATAILSDPVACQYVGAIAYHTYPYGSVYSSVRNILATSGAGRPDASRIAIRASLRSLAARYELPLWMTEVSHGDVDCRSMDDVRGRAVHIHDEFAYADASAYFGMNNMWDMIAQQGHFGNKNLYDSEGTIVLIDNDSAKVLITGIGYAIGHYARRAGRDYYRAESSSTDSLVLATAFVNMWARTFSLVLINNAAEERRVTVQLAPMELSGSISGEASYAEERWKLIAPFAPASTTSFIATLPPRSVVSYGGAFAEATGTKPLVTPRAIEVQVFPNPFTSTSSVLYTLPQRAHVTARVYDSFGREVASLADGLQDAGRHSLRIDATTLPAGSYLLRLDANGVSSTRFLTLIR